MSQIVVITGPIASGKSVVSTAIADRLNAAGLTVGVADLDDTFASIDAPAEELELTWDRARRLHGDLVGRWLSSGVEVVIAHGPFYSPSETSALMRQVPFEVDIRRVMLIANYEVALERVSGDSSRGFSKDPVFLRSSYDRFLHLLPDIEVCDWTFDTTECEVGEIADTITKALIQLRVLDSEPVRPR